MINFFKKLFQWFPKPPIPRPADHIAHVNKMVAPVLLLAAPDSDRWIEPDFFAHCIVHKIEERLEALIAKPKLDIFDTAIEIAELEATYNRLLPKLINYKHDPMRVRIRAVDPGDSTSSV